MWNYLYNKNIFSVNSNSITTLKTPVSIKWALRRELTGLSGLSSLLPVAYTQPGMGTPDPRRLLHLWLLWPWPHVPSAARGWANGSDAQIHTPGTGLPPHKESNAGSQTDEGNNRHDQAAGGPPFCPQGQSSAPLDQDTKI